MVLEVSTSLATFFIFCSPGVVAHVSNEQKQDLKKELVSEAMEFVTTSIHDRVMSRRRPDNNNEKKDSK